MTKTCRKCGIEKAITEFGKVMKGRYYNSYCRSCMHDYVRRWGKTDKGKAHNRAKAKRQYAVHREDRLAKKRAWVVALWDKIFSIYGQLCACCGETERLFLTIDHVNDDGREDQKKGIRKFHRWLASQPKQPDYRILCYNCNSGRYRNGGICPHELKEAQTG